MIQVWLPLPNFKDSARTLSNDHLRQQCIDILRLMESYHEVTAKDSLLPREHQLILSETDSLYRAWLGFSMQLCEYGLITCEELVGRQPPLKENTDDLYGAISNHLDWATSEDSDMSLPNWFGDVDFHVSHQAALVRKDPEHYRRFFKVDPTTPLEWPVSRHAEEA